mgnify:CR=1 FL=1
MQNDQFQKPYSDGTASMIDAEVRKLVDSQYKRAQILLRDKKEELEILANALLEKEVILKSDLERLIGPRPIDVIERAQQNGAIEEETKEA